MKTTQKAHLYSFLNFNFFKVLSLLVITISSPLLTHAQTTLPHPSERPVPPFLISPSCEEFITKLPVDTKYDWISVPEDRNLVSSSKNLFIFYYYKDFSSFPKNSLPTLFLNGGPGSTSRWSYKVLSKTKEFNQIPFIFMDQRGTGCSSPFPYLENTQTGLYLASLYGTREIVEDAESIRERLLGNLKWNIFGHSFGGLVAYRYIILHADHLQSSFIHGSSLMTDGTEWVKRRMLAQRRIGKEYLKIYPDDSKIISKAKSLLKEDTCSTNVGLDPITKKEVFVDETCGNNLIESELTGTLSFPSEWADLHDSIQQILDPKTGELSSTFFTSLTQKNILSSQQVGRIYNMFISNTQDFAGGLGLPDSCRAAYNEVEKSGIDMKEWFLNECYGELTWKFAAEKELANEVGKDLITIDALENSILQNPKMKLHLYSSELDGMVPVETYDELLKRLSSKIAYKHFMRTGHDGFYLESELLNEILLNSKIEVVFKGVF